MSARITPVILSGGSGTRLWPLSTEQRPKQLLALAGAETMLQATAGRVRDGSLFTAPVIVGSARHADEIEAQLGRAGVSIFRLILEPCPRNTAAAIALAALSGGAEDLLLVMPSDHLIARPEAFLAAVGAGRRLAEQGWLVTFGIAADRPETGYGYIRRGAALSEQAFRADAFVEKPDADTAASYVASARYDWNGGIFLFRADAFLSALDEHEPAILAAARAAYQGGERGDVRITPHLESFAASPSRSIDHAVMEKADRIAVVPVDMGWSDVGSWDAVAELGEADDRGNVLDPGTVAIDVDGCLIRSEGPRVTAVGIKDLIIVATGDAVMIVPRQQSQRVKEIVEALKQRSD